MIHLLLVLVQLSFASLAVLGKYAFATIPPDAIVLSRVAGGLLVFSLWARLTGWRRVERVDRLRLVACGLLGVVFNQMFFIHGLERSTATNTVVLGATIPIFAAMFAVLLGHERFLWTRALGIALALAGALTIFRVENFDLAGAHTLGNAMVIINCMSYALFLVLVRPLARKYPAMQLVAMLFSVALVAVSLPGGLAWAELAPRLTWHDVGLLLFIVAFPTVAAYSLTQLALSKVESSVVATYVYLQPVFGVLLAGVFLGEQIGGRHVLAAALIFTGVFVSTRPPRVAPPGGTPLDPGLPSRGAGPPTPAGR